MICVSRHDTLTRVCMHVHTIIHECWQHPVQIFVLSPALPSPTHTAATANITLLAVVHTHMQPNSTPPPTLNSFAFSSLVQVVGVSCIDHVPPNPQVGCTPLMLAAVWGHLPVARLLVETCCCDVNEEDSDVSGLEVMGGVRECSC